MLHFGSSENYVWITNHVLGSGSFGCVYKGVHKRTGEEVAVKMFNPHTYKLPLKVQMREFQLLKDLSHKNIVKMLAMENEVHLRVRVLVMELCSGGSLQRILKDPQNVNGLEEEEFLSVLNDLTAGMKYLRENSIIHRDVKPGNILKYICEDKGPVYKLSDFGSAKIIEDDEEFKSMYGTAEYLHPDIFEEAHNRSENKSFRATSELWSIGVTLYHIATGHIPFRPFQGRNDIVTMRYIHTHKPAGVISGVQRKKDGDIEWSRQLPDSCLLSEELKKLVTILIACLLECKQQNTWTFNHYFDFVKDILTRKVFHIFCMNGGQEISLFMQPHKKLQDLKEEIFGITQVSPSSQLLLFANSPLPEIDSSCDVSKFPSTSLEQPIILVDIENADVKNLKQLETPNVTFPAFLQIASYVKEDASVAKEYCIVAHTVKRSIIKMVRCQQLLLQIPVILIPLLVENVKKLCSDSSVLKLKVDAINTRCGLFKKNCGLISQFLSQWPNVYGHENHAQNIESICSRMKEIVTEKMESRDWVKKEVSQLLSSISLINQRVLISKSLQYEWKIKLSHCLNFDRCVERADTYVKRMCESLEVFTKTAINGVSQSELPYELERVKMGTNREKLAVLRASCFKEYSKTLRMLYDWYIGMQAFMVQCKCLEDVLKCNSNDVKNFSQSLKQRESELFEVAEKVVSALSSTTNFRQQNYSNLNHSIHSQASIRSLNSNWDVDLHKILSNVQQSQQSVQKAAEENKSLIKSYDELFQNMQLECNTLDEASGSSS